MEKLRNEPEFNMQLVKAIELFPCLYNTTLPEYSRKDIAEVAWAKVANEVNDTVPHCKEKWRNLRTVFSRKLKASRNGLSSKYNRPYYLYESMRFILPYIKPSTSNPENLENLALEFTEKRESGSEEEDFLVDPLSLSNEPETTQSTAKIAEFVPVRQTQSRKRKNEPQERPRDDIYDDTRKMFLLSLLPEIHDLTDSEMKQFKRRVLTLLDDIVGNKFVSYGLRS